MIALIIVFGVIFYLIIGVIIVGIDIRLTRRKEAINLEDYYGVICFSVLSWPIIYPIRLFIKLLGKLIRFVSGGPIS